MKYKLSTPVSVGDLTQRIEVDELEIESLSLIFDPQRPVLSIVLLHRPSGWQHNVVYRDSSAVEFWARVYEAEFDFLHKAVLQKIIADKKLPEGTIS